MNRFYPFYIQNVLKARLNMFIYRSIYDFFGTENQEMKYTNSNKSKQLNSNVIGKILKHKDGRTKLQMIQVYIRINPDNKFKAIPVDYLLKSRLKNNAIKFSHIMEDHSCPPQSAVIVSCPPSELAQDTGSKESSSLEFPRSIRGEPGKVVWGFVPKEWTTFFVPVTGHTGFYTLLVTLGTYLFSKEIYVCDHEYYSGLSMAILWIYMVRKYGPTLARYLDKEIDQYEVDLNSLRESLKQNVKELINSEIKQQECMEGQLDLIQAKRENVDLQREAEFRRRQMEVYENVTRILNYQVAVEEVRRRMQHKNAIQWVTQEVQKSLTPELKEQYLQLCLVDIQRLLKENMNETKKK